MKVGCSFPPLGKRHFFREMFYTSLSVFRWAAETRFHRKAQVMHFSTLVFISFKRTAYSENLRVQSGSCKQYLYLLSDSYILHWSIWSWLLIEAWGFHLVKWCIIHQWFWFSSKSRWIEPLFNVTLADSTFQYCIILLYSSYFLLPPSV